MLITQLFDGAQMSDALAGGKIKFAQPSPFVPNLSTFQVQLRPNKYHWKNDRPPTQKSIPALERDLAQIGGSSR